MKIVIAIFLILLLTNLVVAESYCGVCDCSQYVQKKEPQTTLKQGLEIGLIVLIVLLVIIGFVVGFARWKKDDDDDEGKKYY